MLDLDEGQRADLWRRVAALAEESLRGSAGRPLVPELDREALRRSARAFDFAAPMAPDAVLEALADGLRSGQVRTADPRYFGLLHATPAAMTLFAVALASAYNPQLAIEGHAPFAVALEDHLVVSIAERLGFPRAQAEGVFTSGGAEANTTALVAALARSIPDVARRGLRAAPADPAVYVSSEGHATVARAARITGLGSDAVRVVPADKAQRMKTGALREAIARDRAAGALPVMIVATAGTTSSGAIDPLDEIADVAEKAGAWLHVDAAWGGLLALVPEQRAALAACARADSITFDPHKALALPLGAGMFLTRHAGMLAGALHDRAGYMPRDASRDPYARSLAWSRRFVGAQLFAVLAAHGWDGVAASLRRQLAMGERLRAALACDGWTIVNETPLPVVCFVDAGDGGASGKHLERVARGVIGSGAGWLSVTRFASGGRALRACVTSHRTGEEDVDRLVAALGGARRAARADAGGAGEPGEPAAPGDPADRGETR